MAASFSPLGDLRDENNFAENNIRANFPGYDVYFNFPTCPIADEKNISFAGYVKNVFDSFTPTYEPKQVYGRMDPIPVYQRTTRTVSFDLSIPSNSLEQSRIIGQKLSILVRNTYPSYESSYSVNVISSPPLVRIFFSSFINNPIGENGLLGYFSKPVDIKHQLNEKGVFVRAEGYEAYAKAYELNFAINVLHEYTPGYINYNGIVRNEQSILGRIR